MPKRYSTRRSYEAWLRNHIVPKFGPCAISRCKRVRQSCGWNPLTEPHGSGQPFRGLLRILWDFAMWSGSVPTQRNPMELVTIKGASKRPRKPRSLTVDEFQGFVHHLGEPFHAICLVCVCFQGGMPRHLTGRATGLQCCKQPSPPAF